MGSLAAGGGWDFWEEDEDVDEDEAEDMEVELEGSDVEVDEESVASALAARMGRKERNFIFFLLLSVFGFVYNCRR